MPVNDIVNSGLFVRDLLQIPHFKEARLLGGDAGLDNIVSRVNVMEVPDVVDWVRSGEFLMTTGYPFRKHPEVMASLIEKLASKGVVALGIKTKRFIETVPEVAIEAANRYGLPLIELPPDTTFSDVVREVMERVLVQESRQLSMLQSRVQHLSHVLMRGDGIVAFLNHLEEQVQHPIVLLNPNAEWTASSQAQQLCEQLTQEDWLRIRSDRVFGASVLANGDKTSRVHIFTIRSGSSPYMLLMVEDRNEQQLVDTLTMNWAAELLGFEISNAQARKQIEAKYIDQFLQDWIVGRIISHSDLLIRAEACGCPIEENASYRVGVVLFDGRKPVLSVLRELARSLNWESATGRMTHKWTVLEEELVVILMRTNARGEHASAFRKEEAGEALVALKHALAGAGRRVQLCVGQAVDNKEAVQSSYKEAKRAFRVSAICHIQDDVVSYGELGLYQLICRLADTEEAENFLASYLIPLIAYDQKHQASFIKTIDMYLSCNGNVKETSERLFLHYNTVTYRLDRIRQEFGLSLDDAETRLLLQMALKLYAISNKDEWKMESER